MSLKDIIPGLFFSYQMRDMWGKNVMYYCAKYLKYQEFIQKKFLK